MDKEWCRKWAQQSLDNGGHSVTHVSGQDLMDLVTDHDILEAIVKDLADCDSPEQDEQGGCTLCGFGDVYESTHSFDCPYARAVKYKTPKSTCQHCQRHILHIDGIWIDPEATGDDSIWRETCDYHDTSQADHEPQS